MPERLEDIAIAMVAEGQGILAADESGGTIEKRFATIGVNSTEENRRDYREMLFRADEAMKDCISGVILYEETLFQNAADGTPLIDLIRGAGTVPGIKVDKGASLLPGSQMEKVTEGLDGLRDRLAKYHERGARFAKWRAVITIADGKPTWNCVKANTHALARYAALSQEAGIVPIVEPEILMDGEHCRHSVERCHEVTEWVLATQFSELFDAGIAFDGMILKPNMVVAGQKSGQSVSVEEVAERTVRCLKATVPSLVPGIAFLSGGQSDEEATSHLSAMNAMYDTPWKLTFSYGRALQAAALQAWRGKAENVAAAQRAFSHRARMNALAATGQWRADMEQAA